ncbi:Asp23/Gls24 family envelope stress response protein [Actinosynnema sp. NPDC020468]|uniref:Asp23/Gls24 family envelope stress response protein n=1 Tax=Actinosynnema sp. NPDC020468 TaxID=3154488 RepID=UPI0033DAA24D
MTAPAVDPGRLVLTDRAVERLASRAVLEVPDVHPVGTRRAPSVTARVTGDRATLRVHLSITYPRPVARTAEAARAHLTRRVGELTGLTVTRVDISVGALPGPVPSSRVG